MSNKLHCSVDMDYTFIYISLLQKGELVFSGVRNKDPNKSKDI